jgi:hypothetical protein
MMINASRTVVKGRCGDDLGKYLTSPPFEFEAGLVLIAHTIKSSQGVPVEDLGGRARQAVSFAVLDSVVRCNKQLRCW